jgi:phytoene dehydrogenase-like protein
MTTAIIGGGIAGLTAGIFAARSGFDVTIYEKHSIPGGFSTSWKRGGYLFEGGMHFLTGSGEKTPLYGLWRDIGAIEDETNIALKDPTSVAEASGFRFHLFRDPDKIFTEIMRISPDDEKAAKLLVSDIKKFSAISMPVVDIKGVKSEPPHKPDIAAMQKMFPAFLKMGKYRDMNMDDYADKFKNPAVRLALKNIAGPGFNAVSSLTTLGCYARGDGGYLENGSMGMVKRIAQTFKEAGGTLKLNTEVLKVNTRNGKAIGIKTAVGDVDYDAVIITSDTLTAIDRYFENPINSDWANTMRNVTKPLCNIFISAGIKADLSHYPDMCLFALENPIFCGGMYITAVGFHNYAKNKGYAPDGCTAITSAVLGDTYDYWKAAKDNGNYEKLKAETADIYLDLLSKFIPEIKGKIDVIDVATPLTYERYCGSYKGSWMSVWDKGKVPAYHIKSAEFDSLYFAGERLKPPGGLPSAVMSGFEAAQFLCRDNDVIFKASPHS